MAPVRKLCTVVASLAALAVAAPSVRAQTYPTGNDPRNGLKYGKLDAGEAARGMRLVSFTPKPAAFDSAAGLTFINSDIAFKDHYVYQGNFAGFMIWDVANPDKPVSVAVVPCITAQGDPSIYGNLLFISAEGRLARTPFLIAAAILFGALIVYEAVATGALRLLTGWIVYPALIYFAACVLSKRLHDRGRSGWYAALVLCAFVAMWPQPVGVLDFLFSIVIVWAVVELGVLSGEQGANRFGLNPLRPVAG